MTPHTRSFRTLLARFAPLTFAALAVLTLVASSHADDPVAPDGASMMGGSGADKPVVHDAGYFEKSVLPVLAQQCLGCHDGADPLNKSRNRMAAPDAKGTFTAEAVRANYENIRALASAQTPERSLVLSKLIPVQRGGVDHDGGKADDNALPASLTDTKGPFVQWLFGASSTDTPPVASYMSPPRMIQIGDEVKLDATASSDPEGKPVTVRWEIADQPQGARAKIEDPQAKLTRIVPDREGPWVLRLRVSDGTLRGWPTSVRFAVTRRAETKPDPVSADAAATIDTGTRRATRALFLDLWGRTPSDEELVRYAAMPREKRVDAMLDTDATWQNWLDEEAFYFLLIDQFRPVSDRLVAVPARMRSGSGNFREAHQLLALSAEFNTRNPGNDTYCTVVLEQFLGMEVQKGGNARILETAKKIYDGKQERLFNTLAKNQSDIVQITLDQKAYVDLFVKRMARRYLAADLAAGEQDATVALLIGEPAHFKQVLRDWLLSDRYDGPLRAPRTKSDPQFIRSLFVDLLGRTPAYEEFRNMRNALQALADPTPLRGVLAKVLLDSPSAIPPRADEATKETYTGDRLRQPITELFRRFLGRDPETTEMDAFVSVLKEPGTTWRTAALAILTSAQYQLY